MICMGLVLVELTNTTGYGKTSQQMTIYICCCSSFFLPSFLVRENSIFVCQSQILIHQHDACLMLISFNFCNDIIGGANGKLNHMFLINHHLGLENTHKAKIRKIGSY